MEKCRDESQARVVDREPVVPLANALPDAERRGGSRCVIRLDVVAYDSHGAVAEHGVEGACVSGAELIEAVLSAAIGLRRDDSPANFVAIPPGGESLVVVRLGLTEIFGTQSLFADE